MQRSSCSKSQEIPKNGRRRRRRRNQSKGMHTYRKNEMASRIQLTVEQQQQQRQPTNQPIDRPSDRPTVCFTHTDTQCNAMLCLCEVNQHIYARAALSQTSLLNGFGGPFFLSFHPLLLHSITRTHARTHARADQRASERFSTFSSIASVNKHTQYLDREEKKQKKKKKTSLISSSTSRICCC